MTDSDYISQCAAAKAQLAAGELDEAVKTAHQACSSFPGEGMAYLVIASALVLKKDFLSALETYEIVCLLDPDDAEANEGVRSVLAYLRKTPDLENITRPLPELSVFAYYSKACRRFWRIRLLDAAARAGELADGEASDVLLTSIMVNIDAALCKWDQYKDHARQVHNYVSSKNPVAPVSPLMSLCLQDDPDTHLKVAQRFLNDQAGHEAVINRKLRPLGKLKARPRIGYLSADFHDHATSRLMVGFLEAHDRGAWDVVGLSYGANDGSAMRKRVENAFETFVDLHGKPVQKNLHTLKGLHLDLLVDAKGLTSNFELAYSISRPAPVVVNYLAYPGSMGSSAYDYVVGDRVVTPFEHQSSFSECIVQLPHTYQPNDPERAASARVPDRAEIGLPENAFVIAAFNQTKKITPDQFQCWMRILLSMPKAVLWLYSTNETAEKNLRASAQENGVDADRLVFAPKLPLNQHLARHHLADIFLDTFPYNAHTTASDALWMGLPVVTLQGKSFASRVGASLLEAVGLPELITRSIHEYESLTLSLARRPEQLQAYKKHLVERRENSFLFDARTYARDVEQAYAFMIERSRKGKAAHSFEVRSVSEGGGIRLAGGADFKTVQPYLTRGL
jgi:protein O-GlcNAc transferase